MTSILQTKRDKGSLRYAAFVLTLSVVSVFPAVAFASDYFVSGASGASGNGAQTAPFSTIQEALEVAQPGDTVILMPGVHLDDFKTVRDGRKGQPIVIIGQTGAVLKGGGELRVAEINHDFIELRDFVIDGHFKPENTKDAYRDKLVYVIGKDPGDGVTGLRIANMTIQNAGGECIRLKYQTRGNEIVGSTISNCGRHDFQFGGGKNGEGIYIGTAPEQLGKFGSPDSAPDHSDGNWIHHNIINTQANECVDIKEGSSANIVEHNQCSGQTDPESAGLDARGNGNTFRFNTVNGSVGAGVRLGGDGETDGIANDVYGNTLIGNKQGPMRIVRGPQGKICENVALDNGDRRPNDFMKVVDVSADCSAQIATAEGRAGLAIASLATEGSGKKSVATLQCDTAGVQCAIGLIMGDARSRIKIYEASQAPLSGKALYLVSAVTKAGKAADIASLAGKTVLVEFTGLDEKRLSEARIVSVLDGYSRKRSSNPTENTSTN